MGGIQLTFLLDTHAILWALTDPTRLGTRAREVLEDRSSGIVVSSASAWEIATKNRIGKLPHADVITGGYATHLDRLGVTRLAISEAHALFGGSLNWAHRDPFDRILAAQAMLESFTLITDDAAFKELAGIRTLW